MLADPCADPGIFARGVQARLPENISDNVFFFIFLSSTFTVLQWIINVFFFSKKTIILQGFGGGEGCPIFSRGPNLFQGGQTFSRGGGGGVGGSKC